MRTQLPRRTAESEQGATMVFVAATMILLIGVAALAVDLSGLRLDRAIDQRVTDAAATAGAITLFESNGRAGCVTALGYLASNAPQIDDDAFALETCSNIPISCSPTDPAFVQPVPIGRFTINIVHPVPDADPLMTSAAIGAPTQSAVAADGDQCARIGVQISADRDTTFAQVLGSDQNTTTVHSVAIAEEGENTSTPAALLLLDRTACQTIHSKGGGSLPGGIEVAPVIVDGNVLPGSAASDSNGQLCGSDQGIVFKEGSNSIIRIDGPVGCSTDDATTPSVGEGCGTLQVFHPDADGVNCAPFPCKANGTTAPKPLPTYLPERITRKPVDHLFNCVPDYDPVAGLDATYGYISWATSPLTSPDFNIEGCAGGSSYVYDLIVSVGESGLPSGFTEYPGPCVITTPEVLPTGNYWFSCPHLEVKDTLEITGNAVFEGSVTVTGGTGQLTINSGDGFAFFRGSAGFFSGSDQFTKDGGSTISFNDTFVYLSKNMALDFSGSNGPITWTAPLSGAFEDLALWSDSFSTHFWSGQSGLDLEGAFFMPWAKAVYSGNGTQVQEAQFIAGSIRVEGNGILRLEPTVPRSVPVDPPIVAELIR